VRLHPRPQLRSHGYACEVIAPAKIARRPGDRIKTDRRDALLLARAARAGELVSVTIPDERDEALPRSLASPEDAVRARLKAASSSRHCCCATGIATAALLLDSSARALPGNRVLCAAAQDIAFAEYRSAVRDAHERVERLTESLRAQLEHWRMRPVVEALMSLRASIW